MHKLFKAFGYAMHGIRYCFTTQQNFRIQVVAFAATLLLFFMLHCSLWQFCIVIFGFANILGMEAANTAIEKLCNFNSTAYNPSIKIIKDVAAAAVLIISLSVAVVTLSIIIQQFMLCKIL
jgi:diacylglycerol kinase